MKVLDLACENRHCFEGWFDSEDDFRSQLARGLLECPICGDTAISKLLSAPRLNLGAAPVQQQAGVPPGAAAQTADGSCAAVTAPPHDAALQAAWFSAMRRLASSTEDVGNRFAEEARRIHYGEAASRGIRGRVSLRETEELLEEGIAVLPLPSALESTEH